MFTALKRFVREEEGASMVEYGLLVALIAVVLIAAVTFLSGKVSTTFSNAGTSMTAS